MSIVRLSTGSAVYGFEAASSTQQEQREGPHSTYLFARAIVVFVHVFVFNTVFNIGEGKKVLSFFVHDLHDLFQLRDHHQNN
jgi:hypothetical protein